MITIIVDGIVYQGFLEIDVTRKLDAICGEFSLMTAPNDPEKIPISVGDFIQVQVDGEIYVTGYIEKLDAAASVDNKSYTFAGRDQMNDLVDSTFLEKTDFSGSTSLESLIKAALKTIKLDGVIGVRKTASNIDTQFNEGENLSAEQGDYYFDFLQKYAFKKSVILTTDGLGNILITRASEVSTDISLLKIRTPTSNNNNILESGMTIDNTQRFGIYQTHSQLSFEQFVETTDKEDIVNSTQTVKDDEIRQTRVFSTNMNSASENVDVKKSALWERNYRRSRGFNYRATVKGFRTVETKKVWTPNTLVRVIDEDFDINTDLLLKQVNFRYSTGEGSITNLVLVPADGFSILAKPKKLSNKESKAANFVQFVPKGNPNDTTN